jgi:hypothetical protein
MSSAVDLESVSENFGVEILCNFNSVKNMLKECRIKNLMSMKVKTSTSRET